MKMPKRIDKINSLGKFAVHVFCIAAYFVFSELVLNFTVFRGVKSDFDYYENLVFSKEESESAEKFKRDLISLGDRVEGIPGTIIFKYKPAERESFTLNSDGFRNKEFTKKEKDEFRIAFFGDSKIFGFAVQNDRTIPAMVEKNLREHFHKNITVLNMGVEALDMQRELATARFYLEKIEPDMLIFYSLVIDINSAFSAGNTDWEPFKGGEKFIPEIELKEEDKTIFDKVRLLNTLKQTFTSDAEKILRQFSGAEIPSLPMSPQQTAFAGEFPEAYLGRIRAATDFFDKKGIVSLFFLQPLIQIKRPLSENEKLNLYRNEMYSPGINLFAVRCTEGVKNALKTGDYDKNIIDHSNLFQNYPDTVFYDGIHYTPKALKLEADKMSEDIIKILESEKSEKLK